MITLKWKIKTKGNRAIFSIWEPSGDRYLWQQNIDVTGIADIYPVLSEVVKSHELFGSRPCCVEKVAA